MWLKLKWWRSCRRSYYVFHPTDDIFFFVTPPLISFFFTPLLISFFTSPLIFFFTQMILFFSLQILFTEEKLRLSIWWIKNIAFLEVAPKHGFLLFPLLMVTNLKWRLCFCGQVSWKATFATTKEINSCLNQNQTSRFESVEIKTLHKIKKTQNKESKNHFSRCKESKKSERITFQTSESTKNQNFKVQTKLWT